MTHQELEHLASDYLEGNLDAARRAQARAHLDQCASCREMIAGLERVLDLCRAAQDLETPPWMVNRILLATVGERKPTLGERLSSLLRPTLQPRLVYGLAMAVFSMTIIFHAAGLKVGQVTLNDLNPANWVRGADRTGHLLLARAERFYYDLRVVYEIESRLKQLRGQSNQPATAPGQQPKPQPPSGGTTDSNPSVDGPPVLAGGSPGTFSNPPDHSRQFEVVSLIHVPDSLAEPARSSTR
jgi:anti-sigma factor RsiW